jgi:hypothetical protein
MSVPKHGLPGGLSPGGHIVHQHRHRHSDSNENVDIKFSVHDAILR